MEPKPIAELHTSILGILLLNSYKTLTTYRCFEQQQFAGYPFLWLYETQYIIQYIWILVHNTLCNIGTAL